MVSKAESKMHQKATDLVHSDKTLNWDDKMFIIDNYYPLQENGRYSNAFFTPYMLARDFIVMNFYRNSKKPVLDLCAGIGVLSLAAVEFDKVPEEEIV